MDKDTVTLDRLFVLTLISILRDEAERVPAWLRALADKIETEMGGASSENT